MALGKKTGGGSRAGVPNKATAKCREVIALIADGMAHEFEGWLRSTAEGVYREVERENGKNEREYMVKPDPKGAADLYLKAIEYHIPKLARTELANSNDSPFVVQVTSYADNKAS